MLSKAAIYLDSNAGAPLHPAVKEALLLLLESKAHLIPNPSSIHSHGRSAKRALADAREKVARSLGASDYEQIVFTSSGSEANQLVIRSVLEASLKKDSAPQWITTPVEHDSNLQMVSWFKEKGGEVCFLPVDSRGVPQVERLSEIVTSRTALMSCLWVNNETGVISPLSQLAEFAHAHGIPLHVDAAQAWGKLPISVETLGVQYLTFSGHKIGGLAGAGGIWLKRGSKVSALILGKQEKSRRGGTENLLGIVAMGAAASQIDPLGWSAKIAPLRDQLEEMIQSRIPGTHVNGQGAPRVANTLNLSFDRVEGDGLVMALDLAGYSVSSGSACSSGVLEPSHVLLAMGKTKLQAMAAVRVSLSHVLSAEVLEGFVSALEKAVLRVRKVKE